MEKREDTAATPQETVNDKFMLWGEQCVGAEDSRVEFKGSAVVSARISAIIKHLLATTPREAQDEEFRKKIRRLEKLSPHVQAWILAKAIAGMANNGGGILYLGVADCGVVTGLQSSFDALKEKIGTKKGAKRTDVFQRILRRRIGKMFRDSIFAGTLYEMQFRKTRKRKLEYCAIRVRPSPVPIFICEEPRLREETEAIPKKNAYGNLFVRVGNSTELCPVRERERFIAARFGKFSKFKKILSFLMDPIRRAVLCAFAGRSSN